MIPKPIILDISEWQVPTTINYAQLSQQISGVIVRVQYGSNYEDKHYKTHITEFKKYNVPVAVYAWVRGTSVSDMEKEACDFYQRVKNFHPTFWWLDVEEHSMSNMRQGVEAYRQQLKKLGAKKVGAYIANHLFNQFKLDTAKFDAIWLPTYGVNNGQYNGSNPTATNDYHIHQYSDRGRLSGYAGYLDLNRIAKGKLADYFGEGKASIIIEERPTRYELITNVYLREGPSTKSKEIALLKKGEKILIHNYCIGEGYLWGEQRRANNKRGYLALGILQEYVKIVK